VNNPTLNSLAETQTSASRPQAGRAPLDLANFAEGLQRHPDGVWRGRGTEPISCPAAGNNACFALEDSSFWFAHRNACLLALLRRFPTAGPFFDIGGGNGFVAAAIQSIGVPVVLVEPGADGVRHAQTRGLRNVVLATLKEGRFRDGSLPAIGFFDVLEHIDDEQAFLREIRRCLAPGGPLAVVGRRCAGRALPPLHLRQPPGGLEARRLPPSVCEQQGQFMKRKGRGGDGLVPGSWRPIGRGAGDEPSPPLS
jgi:SAM-dependent methyltransferase